MSEKEGEAARLATLTPGLREGAMEGESKKLWTGSRLIGAVLVVVAVVMTVGMALPTLLQMEQPAPNLSSIVTLLFAVGLLLVVPWQRLGIEEIAIAGSLLRLRKMEKDQELQKDAIEEISEMTDGNNRDVFAEIEEIRDELKALASDVYKQRPGGAPKSVSAKMKPDQIGSPEEALLSLLGRTRNFMNVARIRTSASKSNNDDVRKLAHLSQRELRRLLRKLVETGQVVSKQSQITNYTLYNLPE